MRGKMLVRIIILLSTIFLSLIIITNLGAAQESKSVQLFYHDTDGLSTNVPSGSQSQTSSVGPNFISSSTTIGRWTTQPLGKNLELSGTVTASIWASGMGNAYFEFELLTNDNPSGTIIRTGSSRLSQSPQEFTGSQSGVTLEMDKESTLGVEATIFFSGQWTVNWGSKNHPAHIMFSCDSMSVGNPSFKIDTDSKKVTINTTIFSAFGLEDISGYNLQISGPTTPEHIMEPETDVDNSRLTVYWVWDYDKDKIETEKDYSITVTVEDNYGNEWTGRADKPIVFEPEEDAVITTEILQIIIIISIIVIVAFLVAYKLFLGKYVEDKLGFLKSNTEYFSDYKLLIVSEILHSLSWYLLLVISLFIFRAAWAGWGDLLVGLNFGLYETVSILLFLSLAKGSDIQGKRKNMLLSLIVIGTVLLFIMAWLSFVPSPAVVIIIIILFTFFVLCYYGTDSLELVLVTEYFPENLRGKAFGLMRAIGNIGGLIGGVLSGFFFDVIGFWFCFLLAAIFMLASFFVLFNIRDVGVEEEKITISEWFGNFLSGTKQFGTKFKGWIKSVSENLSIEIINDYLFGFQNRKQMTLLFYTTLITLIAYGMIVPFIMVFLSEARGESATVLGIVYTVFGVAIFLPINQVAAGWLCDKYSARKVYASAIFAYIGLWGLFNLTIPFTSSNVLIMIVFIFPVWPFLWIGYKMFVADLTPRSERVRGVASIRLALGIGTVIGSISGGLLLYYLSYESVFQLAMFFTFIAAVLAIILLRITGEVDIEKNEK